METTKFFNWFSDMFSHPSQIRLHLSLCQWSQKTCNEFSLRTGFPLLLAAYHLDCMAERMIKDTVLSVCYWKTMKYRALVSSM